MNPNHPRPLMAASTVMVLALALGACASNSRPDTASASTARPASGHSGCFDPRSVRGFAPVGDDVLIVDTGSNHYRVQLDATCFGADSAPAMQFKGDPFSGRVCGRFGESVSWTHHECQIQRVDWITPEEHAALLNPAKKQDAPASN
ncbi:MAG: DUF6491 family protein [Arenimonas sp.]